MEVFFLDFLILSSSLIFLVNLESFECADIGWFFITTCVIERLSYLNSVVLDINFIIMGADNDLEVQLGRLLNRDGVYSEL